MHKRLLICCGILLAQLLSAQTVYERHTVEVYNYLSRLSQKGIIVFDDIVRPLSKATIAAALDSAAAHDTQLSGPEKKELAFYRKEFTEGARKRILQVRTPDFTLQADPIVTAGYTTGKDKSIRTTSMGINLWGSFSKHWGYQFSFHDINETGHGIDTSRKGLVAGSETGVVPQGGLPTPRKLNYTDIRGHISYTFKNGVISVGQDYLLWGYGENSKLVLSDKAPTYPYIRLDLQPLPWLHFNYTHAWLKSDVVDSNRSYTIPSGIYGGIREVFVPKFMASHSFDFALARGLHLAVGESMIYNDQVNIAYLLPIMFFKAYDNYAGSGSITRGSNGQFFFQLNSRNQVRNTHLYAGLFIDEIKLGGLFNKTRQRNQLGYTIGGSVTDIGLPYLTAGAEYTRIRPFVYRNFLPAQDYTSSGYLLGDWLGSNADRLQLFLKYTPVARLKLQARYAHIRKGGAGTLEQQYNQQPQPPFLFDFRERTDELYFSASYEYIHRLYLNTYLRRLGSEQAFYIGMTYGL